MSFEIVQVINEADAENITENVSDLADYIVFRTQKLTEQEYRSHARDLLSNFPKKIITHFYIDVAYMLGTPLHLPFDVFAKLESGVLSGIERVGVSIHSGEELDFVQASGTANFVVAGHIFDTLSHPGVPGRGIAWLEEIVKCAKLPVYAIGGITPKNLALIKATGAGGAYIQRGLKPRFRSLDIAVVN